MHWFPQNKRRSFARKSLQAVLSVICVALLLASFNPLFAKPQDLSPEEYKWLEQHSSLRLGVDPGWPPFDFVNSQGNHDGIAANYLRLISQKLGKHFELQRDISWSEALDRAKSREIDIISLAQPTPERKQYLTFTQPVISSPWVIINQHEAPNFADLGEYGNKPIAMVKGYAIVELSRSRYPHLNIQLVDNSLEGLKLVATGSVGAFVENLTTAGYLIQNHGLINLKTAGDAGLGLQELSFSVRSDWPELVSILNKTLSSIPRDDKTRILNQWISQSIKAPSPDIHSENSLLYVTAAIFILIFFVTIYFLGLSRKEQFFLQYGTPRFLIFSLIFVGIFIAAVSTIAWITLAHNKQNALKNIANTLETVRDTTTEGLALWIENQKSYLSHIGTSQNLVDITKRLTQYGNDKVALVKSEALSQSRNFFENEAAVFESYGFFIINKDYISIGSKRDSNLGTTNLIAKQRPDLLDRVFNGETVFVPPIYSDVTLSTSMHSQRPPPTMFIAAPIIDKNREVIAVVTHRLDPGKQLSRLLKLGRIGETGETYAIDQRGLLISESRFTPQLQEVGLLKPGEDSTLAIEIRQPGGNLLEGYRPKMERHELPFTKMAESVIRGEQRTNTSGYPDYRGVPVFGSWTFNQNLGIGIATEINIEEGLATYHNERTSIILSLGIALFLSLGALAFSLSIGTRANRLLKQSHDELEEKVDERTREIQKARETEKTHTEALRRLASNETLEHIFNFLIESLENSISDKLRVSISLLDTKTQLLTYAAAPNLPEFYIKATDRKVIGPNVGLCGSAAYTKKPIIIDDIASHPNFHEYSEYSKKANIVSYWSYPIFSSDNNVLGTFAFYLPVSRTPTKEEEGFILSMVYVAGLAIEKKQSESALIEAMQSAEKASSAKSDFLSSMSHELRTPMNAIIGFSQLLEMDLEDPQQKENAYEIRHAGEHLLSLIDEILDLSKIESGRITTSIEDVSLNSAIEECLPLVSPLAEKHQIRINNLLNKEYIIRADYGRLKQVLLNLLSNAIKYNKERGKVDITCDSKKDKHLRINFVDSGIGISEEQISAIFSPFERAGAEQTDIEGTGIGLVITKKLMELMDGKIGVDSVSGVGSTFWIELSFSEINPLPEKVNLSKEEVQSISKQNKFGKTILYIEDNPANLKLVTQAINTKTDYDIISAPNVALGVELAESHQPCLILMDINLPEIDGYQGLEILKNNAKTQHIPVVAISANAMPTDISKGKGAGFLDYLTKPIDMKRLFSCIDTHSTS